MMNTRKNNCLMVIITGLILMIVCISAAFAESTASDAEKNLAEHGFNMHDVFVDCFGHEPFSPDLGDPSSAPFWLDMTGDGCVDLCSSRMYGSGMVRIETVVYDPVSREKHILDGYFYDYHVDSVSDGRLIVIRTGPNGYGDPVTETTGYVILVEDRLIFVIEPDPEPADSSDPFAPSQAAVSAEQAVRTAHVFALEYLDIKERYANEAYVSYIVLGEEDETIRLCWIISFGFANDPMYFVYVDAETGEVENSYDLSEGIG